MAHCKPKDTKVAIKLTDVEKFQGNTALVRNHGTYLGTPVILSSFQSLYKAPAVVPDTPVQVELMQ